MVFPIALLAFVSLGLPDGVLGVAWPSMRDSFARPLSDLGLLLAAAMSGYLVSTFTSGPLVARTGIGRLLLWSSLVMVVSSLGYATAGVWPMALVAGVLAGLGAGAIDASINAFAAARFPASQVTWLHASYGVGAMLGPLLMTGVLAGGLSWRWGYAAIGALLSLMSLGFALTLALWASAAAPGRAAEEEDARRPGRAPFVETLRRPRVWTNVLQFFVYTGLEVTAGQWTYSLFTEGRGAAPGVAGVWVAVYWASLTLGRIVSGVLARRVPAPANSGSWGSPSSASRSRRSFRS